ncbi:MAG TPA: ABC transporter ATP-binding protein [Amnibacterium sp.]|jgi:putative ABC transport system ATP-binding protein|nr:ABC transporter ATP-binding protein [Amnibacterium sp.]
MYQLTGIGKTYKQGPRIVTALKDVDLTIEDGDHIAIQGQTGGGKSTLLQLLGALDRPSTGSILLDGKDLARSGDAELGRVRARRIGFVFQGFNLIPTLTAQENVETALAPLGVGTAARRRRAAEALASVGLDSRASHLPSELSGGQQQRVAIARALVKDPSVLLADEPTGALDEDTRNDIIELLERIRSERGITLVVVTHDSWVARRAQRRLQLRAGVLTERPVAAQRVG